MDYLPKEYAKTNTIMKKIMIIDGGPRKNFNTASMLQKFAEGASSVTARLRAFLERLIFPWFSYNDYSVTAPKKMPVVLCDAMNANTEQAKMVYQSMGIIEQCLTTAMGGVEHVDAYNTYQVKNYERYELGEFSEEAKRQYRDENWEKDLQRAFDAGKRMAERIMT